MRNLIRSASLPALALALVVAAAGILSGAGVALAQDAEPGKRCLRCHDDRQGLTMLHTKHGQTGDARTPFAAKQCETCHGASDEHVSATTPEGVKRPLADVIFGPGSPTPAGTQNAVCLNCHQGGARMNWAVSAHAGSEISCASCHDLHTTSDGVLTRATQPQVCYTCHVEQRAQGYKRSHHPVREGLVACSDCHNPHGSFGPTLLKQATVNDTCFQCHAEKRGPFLWEHAPVADSCLNCHTPHGSSQPRLLVVRAAWLCQQCHTERFHPSTLYSGEFLPDDSTSTSVPRLVGKSCLNCHQQIHGSNHPSGVRLTR